MRFLPCFSSLFGGHCEERKDEPIQTFVWGSGLLRCARNDGVLHDDLSNTSSSSPRLAKYGASIFGVTSSTRDGDHFGERSLSITAARTPSRKSSLANTSSAARYSRTRHSSSEDDCRASGSNFSVTTMPRGDFSRNVPSVDRASSEPSRASA